MKKNINLKIYWVVTIGPKWQIIVPKESRQHGEFQAWGEYEIALLDDKWFWIVNCDDHFDDIHQYFNIKDVLFIRLWTKCQFVIPVYIREHLSLQSWDNLIVIGKGDWWLGFLKNDNIDFLLEYIKKVFNKFDF